MFWVPRVRLSEIFRCVSEISVRVHAPPCPARVTAVLPLRRNGSVRLAGRLQRVRLTDSKPHVLALVCPRPQHVENDVLKVGQNNVPLPTKSVRMMFPCQQSQSERPSPVNKGSQNDVPLLTMSVRTMFPSQQSQSEQPSPVNKASQNDVPLSTKSVRTTFPC